MDQRMKDRIEELHQSNQHEKIIKLIEQMPALDYDGYCLRARALNNLGRAHEALRDLMQVKDQGEKDPFWNFRVMYSYYELEISDKAVDYGLRSMGAIDYLDKDTVLLVANSYINLAQLQEAVDFLFLYPQEDNPYWNECMGRAYYLQENYEVAYLYLSNTLDLMDLLPPSDQDEDLVQYTGRALYLSYERLGMKNEQELLKERYPKLGVSVNYYSQEDMELLEEHIHHYFGPFDSVFHEILSTDIHVDIAVSPPNENRNYYVLTTMGMGAKLMEHMPDNLKEMGYGRLEILVVLPSNWDIASAEEREYWPIRWLKILSRLPIDEDVWLGWGHTIPNGSPFADNTQLEGILLDMPYDFGYDSYETSLSNGEKVHFLQMIPLYPEEMEYKIKHGTEALNALFGENFSRVVDIHRKNVARAQSRLEGIFKWKNKPVS